MYGASNSIWEMTIGYKAHDANKSCKKLSLMLRAALTWYRIIATCAKKKTYNIHAIEAVPSPMPDKHKQRNHVNHVHVATTAEIVPETSSPYAAHAAVLRPLYGKNNAMTFDLNLSPLDGDCAGMSSGLYNSRMSNEDTTKPRLWLMMSSSLVSRFNAR